MYPEISCWDCKNCNANESCYYDEIKKIQIKIKEQIKNNYIDQMSCASLFDFKTILQNVNTKNHFLLYNIMNS